LEKKKDKKIKFNLDDYAYMDNMPHLGWLWEFERRSIDYKEAYKAQEKGENEYFRDNLSAKNLIFITSCAYDPSKTWAQIPKKRIEKITISTRQGDSKYTIQRNMDLRVRNNDIQPSKIKPKKSQGREKDLSELSLTWKRFLIVYDLIEKFNLKSNKTLKTKEVIDALYQHDSLFGKKKNIERYYKQAENLIVKGGYRNLFILESAKSMQTAFEKAKK
jgi:hypothetical protein